MEDIITMRPEKLQNLNGEEDIKSIKEVIKERNITMRPSKEIYYLNIASQIGLRSTCTRRKFGAIIVKNDTIISTGYNGSVRGAINCGYPMECLKDLYKEKPYESYNHCSSIHAEVNAVINASRIGVSVIGATLYIEQTDSSRKEGDKPCINCRRVIINAGIENCVYRDKSGTIYKERVDRWLEDEDKWMRDQQKNWILEVIDRVFIQYPSVVSDATMHIVGAVDFLVGMVIQEAEPRKIAPFWVGEKIKELLNVTVKEDLT